MIKWRLCVSVVLLAVYFGFLHLYNNAKGPIEGKVAVAQLENSDTAYVASRCVADNGITNIAGFLCSMSFLIVWGTFCANKFTENKEVK